MMDKDKENIESNVPLVKEKVHFESIAISGKT